MQTDTRVVMKDIFVARRSNKGCVAFCPVAFVKLIKNQCYSGLKILLKLFLYGLDHPLRLLTLSTSPSL